MQVSREYALDELKGIRKNISGWIRDIDKPSVLVDGEERQAYPDGVPNGLSIDSVDGVPLNQLRAELIAMAGRIEALAMGVSQV
jgi:hypothetical protein